MLGQLKIVVPPTTYPVTKALVKAHTRIDNTDDDALLDTYIATATAMAEAFLNRALATQTLSWSIADSFAANSWPLVPAPILILPIAMEWSFRHILRRDIEVPRCPVQSVTSVSYANWGDTSDTTLTLATDYDVDTTVDPSRVRLHSDIPWANRAHVTVIYTAGYGAANVPAPILHALLLMISSYYEHRGDAESGEIPEAAKSMLWNYRLMSFQ